jgi:Glycosyl hydrolases family 16
MRRFAALLSFSVALAVFQPTDDAAAAVQTFRPSADTYADAAYPSRSFRGAQRLRVRAGSRPAQQVYARFAVAGLAGTVTRATLRFFVTDGTRNGPAVYLTGAWPTMPLTWSRRPAAVSGPRSDKGRLVRGTWVEWDVTPWVTGDDDYGFVLKGGVGDAAAFMSREAGKKRAPRLVVTTFNAPSTVEYIAPTQGATVSGVRAVRVRAPAGTDWVAVYACGGGSIGEDHVIGTNGEWSVQWNTLTAACTNGTQDLETWAFRDDGSDLAHRSITVEVNNSSLPPPPDPEPPPCPSAEPGPVEGLGYHLRFSDCFNTFSRSVWCSNQWWEPTPPPGTEYAEDGVLHLVRRRSDGYPNVTVSSEPCGQASPKSFRQGYFEAKLRWTGVPGSGPAFWLLSTAHATNPNWPQPACALPTCLSAEIDVFEGYGNHLNVFTGTIHRNSCECYGAPSAMNSNNWQPQPGMNLSTWHVYAARWTATNVTWYLDNRMIMSAPVFDSTNQPMHLLFYNWATPWQDGNETGASTPAELHTEVDWVRVWQQ